MALTLMRFVVLLGRESEKTLRVGSDTKLKILNWFVEHAELLWSRAESLVVHNAQPDR
ncbi:hypothetical protein ALQ74_200038 [Pseudomonas savastanoi pv. glycinea]|uniref:Uncharacterized protein n=2 Tax=Pseudomonas savastanoi TaxID=29438 RepID=A0A3M3FWQ7_PSESG|nr:hypothetical protein ALQ74_200038 [Pseudomonas savastanoi pv. glycinea]RMU16981.1 hypothetical protein ALP34_200096 [Pseudomonas savastanoi pv. glycinea]RMU26342.1 hypothetical protein ALP35_200089 [Pseudomonas savastanoi pv. glycinea]